MSLLTRFHRRRADSAHAPAVEPLQRLKHAELLRPEPQTSAAARHLATNRFCTAWTHCGHSHRISALPNLLRSGSLRYCAKRISLLASKIENVIRVHQTLDRFP